MRNVHREDNILTLLAPREQLSVRELAAALDVSPATVRRDLADLEERGRVRRLHGGATLEGISRGEPVFEDKEALNSEGKMAIAEAALALIEDGDSIFLDGGSTVLMLARLLDRKRGLSVVTNSLSAASRLIDTEHRLILTGGECRSISRTLVGPMTAPVIESLRVDRAFMGTIGFTVADGMTTTDPQEAFTKELIMKRAGQVVLLADNAKFGVCSFARSGGLDDIDVVITDKADTHIIETLHQRGVTLIEAKTDTAIIA